VNYTLKKTLQKLGPSPCDLNSKTIKSIKSKFPVPFEHKILWADVNFHNSASGLVLTDTGIFIKGNKELIKKTNRQNKEKKKSTASEDKVQVIKFIYNYIKWENFDINDFSTKKINGEIFVIFNKSEILQISNENKFFSLYSETYKNVTKEASVSASNVFADLESVTPANFAAVNTKTGHGEMAEEALTLIDKLSGKSAEVVGRTNEKNGADRIVNGIEIQTKYCSSASKSINSCFDKETGTFRYYSKNGEPMVLEVPRDQYENALQEFKKKIREGKVPGVTDENDASKYVKKGKLTYNQAKNLCKPGTIESLTYDAVTGVISCSFALGITFLATFVMTYAQSGNRKEAFDEACSAGLQVFGLSFLSHMLSQQVARTTLTNRLISSSEYIVKKLGYKTVQTIVNSIRAMAGKPAISGAAAMKQLAKILRSNVVTSAITFVAFSIPDTYNMFNKKISGGQYAKNMISLGGTMATATGGTLATSAAAAKIAGAVGTTIAPGVGTVIGIAGGFVGGLVGGAVIKATGDAIKEDDSVVVSRLFNAVIVNLVFEYMLNEKEVDEVIKSFNSIKAKTIKNLFKNVIASKEQEKTIEDFLRPYFDEIIKKRPRVKEPTPQELVDFLVELGGNDEKANEAKEVFEKSRDISPNTTPNKRPKQKYSLQLRFEKIYGYKPNLGNNISNNNVIEETSQNQIDASEIVHIFDNKIVLAHKGIYVKGMVSLYSDISSASLETSENTSVVILKKKDGTEYKITTVEETQKLIEFLNYAIS